MVCYHNDCRDTIKRMFHCSHPNRTTIQRRHNGSGKRIDYFSNESRIANKLLDGVGCSNVVYLSKKEGFSRFFPWESIYCIVNYKCIDRGILFVFYHRFYTWWSNVSPMAVIHWSYDALNFQLRFTGNWTIWRPSSVKRLVRQTVGKTQSCGRTSFLRLFFRWIPEAVKIIFRCFAVFFNLFL